MTIILTTLKKVLFWSYERGSWQYDVMCVLILAFIIFVPNRVFEDHSSSKPIVIRAEEIGTVDRDHLKDALAARLRQKTGNDVSISRIEQTRDDSGEAYVVYVNKAN